MIDTESTWLHTGPLTAEQRATVIASVDDTITADEAAQILGCTVAEVEAEAAILDEMRRRRRS